MMIPVLQELVLWLGQLRVSRWSCGCLPRLWSPWPWLAQGADICSHQHPPSALSMFPWTSEDSLGIWGQPGLKPWLLSEDVLGGQFWSLQWRGCISESAGMSYRVLNIEVSAGSPCCQTLGESSDFSNLPQFPHNWTSKWSGLGHPLCYLSRDMGIWVLETSKALLSLTCCEQQTKNFCPLTSALSPLTHCWLKHLFHSGFEYTMM